MRKREADFLRALYLLDSEQRLLLLRRASPELIKCICECALNILLGNVPLKTREKNNCANMLMFCESWPIKRKATKEK